MVVTQGFLGDGVSRRSSLRAGGRSGISRARSRRTNKEGERESAARDVPVPDAQDKVDEDGDKDEAAHDDGPVRLVVVARVPHDDAVPADAVHDPGVREHAARDDGVAHAHRLGRVVARPGRVEQGERERRQEERDAEPGEEGALRGEPDLCAHGQDVSSRSRLQLRSAGQERARPDGACERTRATRRIETHLGLDLGRVGAELLKAVVGRCRRAVGRAIAARPCGGALRARIMGQGQLARR